MDIRLITHGSEEYRKMIGLRISQLLDPIGVPASYIDMEKEREDTLIGAFEDEAIIGCCVLTPREREMVQLRQMAVRSDLRGKGIGAALLSYAEQVARTKGYVQLVMHARDPVIGFYQNSGYEISGEPFIEVGIGHHKMQKRL